MADNEQGREWKLRKENFKVEITFNMKCQHNYYPLFAWIIIFVGYWYLVYKLNINNHKTVSNENDMNNLFN